MKFADNSAHVYPVKRHPHIGFNWVGTITLRLRDRRKGKRIDEGSETVWIKGLDRSRCVKRQGTAEGPRRECSRGSNRGLAKKSAASRQEINLRYSQSEQLAAQLKSTAGTSILP